MYYFSIDKENVEEITIKKSRFIGYISPVQNEDDIQRILQNVRERWPEAKHYCYAYILRDKGIERYSDDGEPSGTAGLPILSILKNNNLKDVIAVVTRYFGGILLGASGLVRAYSQATSQVVQKAGIKRFELCTHLNVITDYTYWGNIEHKCLYQDNIVIENIEYYDKVAIDLYCPVDVEEIFINKIIAISNGTAIINRLEKKYKSMKSS